MPRWPHNSSAATGDRALRRYGPCSPSANVKSCTWWARGSLTRRLPKPSTSPRARSRTSSRVSAARPASVAAPSWLTGRRRISELGAAEPRRGTLSAAQRLADESASAAGEAVPPHVRLLVPLLERLARLAGPPEHRRTHAQLLDDLPAWLVGEELVEHAAGPDLRVVDSQKPSAA